MLELHEPGADGGDVALLVAERYPARSFRVLKFRIGIDSRVTHSAVQSIHYHCQFDWKHTDRENDGNVYIYCYIIDFKSSRLSLFYLIKLGF